MARVYTVRLFYGVVTGGGASHDLFTVPAGHRYVARGVDGWSEASASDQVYIGVGSNRVLAFKLGATLDPFHWLGYIAVEAGETVTCFPVNGAVHMQMTGYDFLV